MQCSIRKRMIELYLDYVNNYLSVATFALDNNLTPERACLMITIGARLNEIKGLEGAIEITKTGRRNRGYLSQTEKAMILKFEKKIRDIKTP